MTSSTVLKADAIELYLLRLNAALMEVPREIRLEFVREIRAHIFDRLESGLDAPTVLTNLGSAEQLAQQFCAENALVRSARSWSAWTLMRTAARWALTGVYGFAAFLVGFVGYLFGACFYITAALKPIFPHNIGVFVGRHGIQLACWPVPDGCEIAGSYYTLIALVAGFIITALTTVVLRQMMVKMAAASRFLSA